KLLPGGDLKKIAEEIKIRLRDCDTKLPRLDELDDEDKKSVWTRLLIYIGFCHEYGIKTEENPEEAIQWYKLAAEKSDDWGQCLLAYCHLDGKGTEKDENQAFSLFRDLGLE